MGYKNIQGVLLAATKYPASIEAVLPAGAPKVSTMLAEAAVQMPAVPDLPIEIPDLPDAPALPTLPIPELPTPPTAAARVNGPQVMATASPQRFVSGVEVVPLQATKEYFPAAPNSWPTSKGVVPEVVTRRGM